MARKLGAAHYIDSHQQDPAGDLTRPGRAKAIVATVTSGGAMAGVVGGLGINGKLIVLGAPQDPPQIRAGFVDRRPPLDRGLAIGNLDRIPGCNCHSAP